jgi:hypothetical protein
MHCKSDSRLFISMSSIAYDGNMDPTSDIEIAATRKDSVGFRTYSVASPR